MISFARFLTLVLLLPLFWQISACSSSGPRNQYARREDGRPLVDDKYSLKADRDQLDEYRKDLPPEKRRENDEVAFILQYFQEVKKAPSDIREKFDSVVRKKRALFDKDITRERENFTKEERKARDEFLKNQKNDRDAFLRDKPGRERRDEFMKDQEDKRKDYFANQREKRDDFESDVRERRKNFEDYVREKQNEFNSEYRAYSRRYDEMKKQKESERREREKAGAAVPAGANAGNSEAAELDREIEESRGKPAQSLGPGE